MNYCGTRMGVWERNRKVFIPVPAYKDKDQNSPQIICHISNKIKPRLCNYRDNLTMIRSRPSPRPRSHDSILPLSMLSADCLPTVAVLLRLQPSAPPPLPNPAVQFNGDDYWRKALTWSRGKFSQLRLFWSVARRSLLVSLLHKFEFSLSQHLRIVPQLLLSHSYFSQFSCTSSFCVPSREKDAGAMCSGWIRSGSLFLKEAARKRKERRWQSYVKSKQHAWMTRDKNTRNETEHGERPKFAECLAMVQISVKQINFAWDGHDLFERQS